MEDSVYWDIHVAHPGMYEVSLAYACPASGVGARVAVTAGKAELNRKIETATPMEFLPNHNRVDNTHYIDLAWANLRMGQARLEKGPARLRVKALSKPGRTVMQLKSVSLRRLE